MDKQRSILVLFWLLAFIAYLIPWSESSKGFHNGLGLLPFTTPYLSGLVLGLHAAFVVKTRRFLLAAVAGILMIIGVLLVVFWWYGLALHYVATGGGVAELEPGVWFALAIPLAYLLLSIYMHIAKNSFRLAISSALNKHSRHRSTKLSMVDLVA